jgi:hypothetical protein
MAMNVKERSIRFRKKMYAAGFRQKQIWVPVKKEALTAKMLRKAFSEKLWELTAGWTRVRLSELFNVLLKVIEKHAKEGKRK